MLGQSFITKLLFYRNVLCEVDLKPLSLPLEAEVVQWLLFPFATRRYETHIYLNFHALL